MPSQGFLEIVLFFAMVIGVYLASFELLFPTKNKPTPTADDEENG